MHYGASGIEATTRGDLLPRVTLDAYSAKHKEYHELGSDYVGSIFANMSLQNPVLAERLPYSIGELAFRHADLQPFDDLMNTAAETYRTLQLQARLDDRVLPEVSQRVYEGADLALQQSPKFLDENLDLLQRDNRIMRKSIGHYALLEQVGRFDEGMLHMSVALLVYRALHNQAEIDALNALMLNSDKS